MIQPFDYSKNYYYPISLHHPFPSLSYAARGRGCLNKSVKLYIMTKTTLDQKSNRNLLKIEQIPAVFPPTYQSNTSVLLLGKIFG